MTTIFYNGLKLISIDEATNAYIRENLEILKKRYEHMTDREFKKDVLKYMNTELENGNEEILDMNREELSIEFWKAILDGYKPCEGFTMSNKTEPEDYDSDNETECDESCDDNDDGKLQIMYTRNGAVFTIDVMPPKYAACGCPMCGGYLRTIGHSERLEMPDLYFATCESCNAQIGFSEKEKEFFPLSDEKPAKKE